MQRHRMTRHLAALGSLMVLPGAANAQAFGINEIGTCAASRAFAVTGAQCQDASMIFWNPGAVPATKGWSALAGATLISIDAKFKQDTTLREFDGDVPTAFVPHAFVTYQAENSRLAYGLGVYIPYGLTSEWGEDFPGRFLARRAALGAVYIQPNVAYRINDKWSVGGGPVVGHSAVELKQALDLSEQVVSAGPPPVTFAQLGVLRGTEFGRADLEASAWAFGVHVGVYGKPNDDWSVGLRILTPLEFKYDDGDVSFEQRSTGIILPPNNPICFPATRPAFCSGPSDIVDVDADILAPQFAAGGPLENQGAATGITHPAQVQAGLGYSGFTDWLISFDYAWTGWSRFKELDVDFSGPAPDRTLIQDYNNTSAFRAGILRKFANGANASVGISGVASAAPDETVTPLLPEQDRAYLSLGGEYPFMSRWAVQAAYLRVMGPGKRGRVVERTDRAQTAAQLNTGVYELSANVLSISLKAIF